MEGWAGPYLAVVSTYVLPTGTAVEADMASSPFLEQVGDGFFLGDWRIGDVRSFGYLRRVDGSGSLDP